MLWSPDLSRYGKPAYLAIADAIAADLQAKRLNVGDRLPAQRDLAEQLGLNFTTVARGYAEAQRRGLIESRVGQGTFVSGRGRPNVDQTRTGTVDLLMNLPPEPQDPALRERMSAGLSALGGDLQALLRYQVFGGSPAERDAAGRYLARRGIEIHPDRVLVCPGTHIAFHAILQHLTRPDDVVLCEAVTYPGIRGVAARLGVRLEGVAAGAEGIDPDDFDRLCAALHPKALYLNPTLLNPTAALMPVDRRERVADSARKHGVAIIEDDAYGALLENPVPAFVSLAPRLTYYVSGVSKTLGAGLRVAYAIAPDQRAHWAVASAIRSAATMTSPLGAALSTLWIDDGTADLIIAEVRRETRERQALLREKIPERYFETHAEAFHCWLRLGSNWNRSSFVEAAKPTGLSIVSSDGFTVSGEPEEAVRLSLGGAGTQDELRRALEYLGYLLDQRPHTADLY